MTKLRAWIYSLRPAQWVKNGFIFLPLVFGAKLFSSPENLHVLLGIFLFSFGTGAVYLINDTIDLEKDTLHPVKRLRPIASGKIRPDEAVISAAVLAAASALAALWLNPEFGFLLILYVVLNLFYSKFLKDIVIVDVFMLGVFFLIRVLAGCVLAGVVMSHWLLFMTGLLALFLGFNKRRQEIKLLGEHAKSHRKVLSKYTPYFIDQMIAVITSSIVVAYMLYTVDDRTVEIFKTDHLIYTIPFVYYGVFRYLYLLQRYHKDGDPTRILLMDRPLQLNVLAWVMVAVAVIYFHF